MIIVTWFDTKAYPTPVATTCADAGRSTVGYLSIEPDIHDEVSN